MLTIYADLRQTVLQRIAIQSWVEAEHLVGRWHVIILNLSFIIILSCYGFITLYKSPTIVLFQWTWFCWPYYAALLPIGGGRILRRTLSVCLSVCLSVRPVIITERHVAPPSELQ